MILKRSLLLLTTFSSAARATSNRNFSTNPLYHLAQFPFSSFNYTAQNMTRLAPVISISHGGGPMPVLGDPGHAEIVSSLRTRVPQILKLGTAEQPRAIVLVTAHWNTAKPTISSGTKHDLFYDYYGFPSEAYELEYNAPGSPEVAGLVESAFKSVGLEPRLDPQRGMLRIYAGTGDDV